MTTTDLNEIRLRKERKRRRQLLETSERWTPRETIEAVLLDLELGELTDVEAISVVVSTHNREDGEDYSRVQTYVGTNGVSGPKETFWVIGMLNKAIIQRFD